MLVRSTSISTRSRAVLVTVLVAAHVRSHQSCFCCGIVRTTHDDQQEQYYDGSSSLALPHPHTTTRGLINSSLYFRQKIIKRQPRIPSLLFQGWKKTPEDLRKSQGGGGGDPPRGATSVPDGGEDYDVEKIAKVQKVLDHHVLEPELAADFATLNDEELDMVGS